MKKWLLLGVMGVFVLLPILSWASTLSSSLPLSAALYTAGRLLALAGFVFIFFQYVFSAKIKWIERGIGLDNMFAIHRTSGKVGLVLILIHPVPLLLSDLVNGRLPAMPPAKLVGVLALTLFVVAVGAALLYSRLRLKYETWKAIHWLAMVALPLGFVHSLILGSDLKRPLLRVFWFVLAVLYTLIMAHKLWLRFYTRSHPFQIVKVVQETHNTWSLYFKGRRITYQPGQFLIVRLLRNNRVSEPHPFTLSSSPTRDLLSISVKAVGDFTATIGDTTPWDQAYIDAPYGVFSFLNHDAQSLVMIAGGIGITPFVSTLRYMHDTGLRRDVTVIWGNRTEQDIAFREELDQIAAAMPSLRIVHVMSSQEDWPGEKGYVTVALLDKYIDLARDPHVFVCGPPVMTGKILEALRQLGVPKQRIHYERFALR